MAVKIYQRSYTFTGKIGTIGNAKTAKEHRLLSGHVIFLLAQAPHLNLSEPKKCGKTIQSMAS